MPKKKKEKNQPLYIFSWKVKIIKMSLTVSENSLSNGPGHLKPIVIPSLNGSNRHKSLLRKVNFVH